MRSLVRMIGLRLSLLVLVPACAPVEEQPLLEQGLLREQVRLEQLLDVRPLPSLEEVR
ncbi:MAG TPA: hypothetical protein VEU33_45920 [Archangium sp.]|nr:hypothetical protein [Archangium sp.]